MMSTKPRRLHRHLPGWRGTGCKANEIGLIDEEPPITRDSLRYAGKRMLITFIAVCYVVLSFLVEPVRGIDAVAAAMRALRVREAVAPGRAMVNSAEFRWKAATEIIACNVEVFERQPRCRKRCQRA